MEFQRRPRLRSRGLAGPGWYLTFHVGWVSDPAAATLRFRDPHGRVEADIVENGVAILIYDTALDRASVVEILDEDGNVLHAAPLA